MDATHPAAVCHRKDDRALQRFGQDLIAVPLGTGRGGTVRQCDLDGRRYRAFLRLLCEERLTTNERRPLYRIFGRCRLALGHVDQGVDPIAQEAMLSDLGFRQLLALHRLDRIAPEGRDLTDLTCHADLSAETRGDHSMEA